MVLPFPLSFDYYAECLKSLHEFLLSPGRLQCWQKVLHHQLLLRVALDVARIAVCAAEALPGSFASKLHSWRSATIGSTRVARRAGM